MSDDYDRAFEKNFNLDDASMVLDAMKEIAERMKPLGTKDITSSGTFTLVCPRCQGKLIVAWAKSRRRSRPNSYTAVCDTTPGCLQFMGH